MASGNGEQSNNASKMVKPGTLLLKCDPLVYVGYLAPPILCDACLTMEAAFPEGYKLKRCSLCRLVYYCNAECQRKGWKEGHKYECKYMTSLPQSFELDWWMPRLLLRFILKQQDGKDYYDELEIDGTKVKRRFEDLMPKRSREDSRYSEDAMIRTVKLMLRDKPKIKLPNDAKLRKISGKILDNIHEISNDRFYRVGCGVYLGGSIFDHSCKPMAVPTFQGLTMYVRNIMEIPKSLPIFKVTISYLANTLMPTEERRWMLKEQWNIDCKCEMCEAGEDEMDKEIRSLICTNKSCNAEIDFKHMRNPCNTCGHVMEDRTFYKVLMAYDDAREKLKANDFGDDLEPIEHWIKILRENHFSDKHWLLLRYYDEAVTRCTNLGMKLEKIKFMIKGYEYASKYIAVARRFLHPNDIELIRVLLDLAMCAGALQILEVAEKCVLEAKAIAEVAYGKNSDFSKARIDSDVECLAQARMAREAISQMLKLGLASSNMKA